jgi:bifunctional non-homologous end joining protein LigD
MLAVAGDPPVDSGWAFEFKRDGVRCVTAIGREHVGLHSRNANDITASFSELAVISQLLDGRPSLLDGEIMALDADGLPDFGLLQRRSDVRSRDRSCSPPSRSASTSRMRCDLGHMSV